MKQCPKCGRLIAANAQKCKYCNEWIAGSNATVRLDTGGHRKPFGNSRTTIIAGVVLGVVLAAALAIWGVIGGRPTGSETTTEHKDSVATSTMAIPAERQLVANDATEFAKNLPVQAGVISMEDVTYDASNNVLHFVWTYSGTQTGDQLTNEIKKTMLDMMRSGGVDLIDHSREADAAIVVAYRNAKGQHIGEVNIKPAEYK